MSRAILHAAAGATANEKRTAEAQRAQSLLDFLGALCVSAVILRARWTALTLCVGLLLTLVVGQVCYPAAAAMAQHAGPVITTPTPTPSPTPRPLTLREKLLLTPEAQRRGQIAFLPMIARAAEQQPMLVSAESFTYTVRPGDTFWTLALDFGRDLDTMACATSPLAADVEALRPGQIITVPALRDLCYTVTPGDTLESIARRYGLTVAAIVAVPWNELKG
ncbi:MAG: LysM peptidoglycan-binding domain-containing protein, partial [Anaerolineae bacterium]